MTRGCVAIKKGDSWKGVYNHSNSCPTVLGEEIWDYLQGFKFWYFYNIYWLFERNRKLEFTTEILETFANNLLEFDDWQNFLNGKYHKKNNLTSKNADPLLIKWVYIIDPDTKTMKILINRGGIIAVNEDYFWEKGGIQEKKMYNSEIFIDQNYNWYLVEEIDLNGKEPNWNSLINRATRMRPEGFDE